MTHTSSPAPIIGEVGCLAVGLGVDTDPGHGTMLCLVLGSL